MPFTVKILGTGSATPLKSRHHSAQLLCIDQSYYLIDCGEGTQYRLVEHHLNMNKIGAIFISHLHGDHYLGVVGLISTMNILGRTDPLRLFAPPGLLEIITVQFQVSHTVLNYPLTLTELQHNEKTSIFQDDLCEVFCFPLKHGLPTFGYQFQEKPKPRKLKKEKLNSAISVEEIVQLKSGRDVLDETGTVKYSAEEFLHSPVAGKSYAYCSDTCFFPEVISHILQTDTLYHEATYLEEHKDKALRNNHSTAQEAAVIAREAKVGKLLIGHLSSRYEDFELHLTEARAVFPNTEAALEGKTVHV